MQVLIIDDDVRLGEMVQTYLTGQGLSVTHRASGQSGLATLKAEDFDALVLDLMLPDADGMDLCRQIRREGNQIPILMLTAKGDPIDRVLGLEMGADDYLGKPFNPRELLARLRAITRRGRQQKDTTRLTFGDLVIDRDARQVIVAGEVRRLTSHQFELLWTLANRAGRVLSRDQLMQAVSGHDLAAFDRSIDVHISRIRLAVEADAKKPQRIITVRGVGYVFTRLEGE